MTTYRNIHGRSIQAVTTDPTETVSEGQIWYNTNSDTFKTVLLNAGWSSGGNLLTARQEILGTGTQTAALGSAGYNSPNTGIGALTEEYNGTGWTAGGALNTARFAGSGAGI